MIVLKTLATAQTINIIPREYAAAFSVDIRDDSTNVIKIYEVTNAVTSGNYLQFNLTFDPVLVKNHFYDFRLYVDYNFWNTNFNLWELENTKWNETNLRVAQIFVGKIFCTDQEINQLENKYYKLNEGQYTDNNSYNNEYIVT
tara:strand:+ start:380 stop:808 length:429 start_codon:yes stop_codon:yes gene_type:complete